MHFFEQRKTCGVDFVSVLKLRKKFGSVELYNEKFEFDMCVSFFSYS